MKFGKDIKGVIFDIDGVLLDSMEIWTDLGERYLRRRGKIPEAGLADILFSMSMEQGAEYLKNRYLPGQTCADIMEGLQDMLRTFYYDEVKAKPGAGDLLKKLQDAEVRITAATSSPRGHVEKALARNGLLLYIERIFTCSEIGASKHSPDIYNACADFMGLCRSEICVFEDSLYALKTAAESGYHTVGIYDAKGETDQKGLQETAEIYIRDGMDYLSLL